KGYVAQIPGAENGDNGLKIGTLHWYEEKVSGAVGITEVPVSPPGEIIGNSGRDQLLAIVVVQVIGKRHFVDSGAFNAVALHYKPALAVVGQTLGVVRPEGGAVVGAGANV